MLNVKIKFYRLITILIILLVFILLHYVNFDNDGLIDYGYQLTEISFKFLRGNPPIRDYIQIVIFGLLDIYLWYCFYVWVVYGNNWRPTLAIILLSTLKITSTFIIKIKKNEDMMWFYPGFSLLTTTYYQSNDLIINFNTGFYIILISEMYCLGYNISAIFGIFGLCLNSILLISLRADYSVSLFIGLICGHYFFIVANKYNKFLNFIYNFEKANRFSNITYTNIVNHNLSVQDNFISMALETKHEDIKFYDNINIFYSDKQISDNIFSYSASSIPGQAMFNEDRISIILNKRIKNKKVCMFAIFDGHQGQNTANELKETLFEYMFNDDDLLSNPKDCIINQFKYFDQYLIEKFSDCTREDIDKSGSCVILALIIDNMVYLANLGDSRAMISTGLGDTISRLNNIHVANKEKDRIFKAGGSLFLDNNIIRINPGGFTFSRAIGDIEVKIPKYGGKEGVLISIPDISTFELNDNIDFILLGSDGLFEKLSEADIARSVFETANMSVKTEDNFEEFTKTVTRNLIKKALSNDTKDNISCIFLCCENLHNNYLDKNTNYFSKAVDDIKNKNCNLLYESLEKKFI